VPTKQTLRLIEWNNARVSSERDKSKRFRLRFSVRTLAVLLTLACCYAACWGPTKTRGVEDVRRYVQENPYSPIINLTTSSYEGDIEIWLNETATMPLVVASDCVIGERHYYFWFFGYVAKLPCCLSRP
jgi:hypothetical protein